MVSAPGQNASTRSRAAWRQREDQAVEGVPGADQHRRRHLAVAALRASSSAVTAYGVNASAPMPYTVSVGQHDQLAALDRLDGGGDAAVALGGGRQS